MRFNITFLKFFEEHLFVFIDKFLDLGILGLTQEATDQFIVFLFYLLASEVFAAEHSHKLAVGFEERVERVCLVVPKLHGLLSLGFGFVHFGKLLEDTLKTALFAGLAGRSWRCVAPIAAEFAGFFHVDFLTYEQAETTVIGSADGAEGLFLLEHGIVDVDVTLPKVDEVRSENFGSSSMTPCRSTIREL